MVTAVNGSLGPREVEETFKYIVLIHEHGTIKISQSLSYVKFPSAFEMTSYATIALMR